MQQKEDKRRILFLTGTRADFGKIKSLLAALKEDAEFFVDVFVTGMHMLWKYGYTVIEVERCQPNHIFKFINQNSNDSMDQVLAKTVMGLSDYIKENPPEMIVVHGDRVEALAGAIVGSLNNIRVAHIEGGEVSGTIDELLRHAVTKMSHLHFVANQEAKTRLVQLGESEDSIFIVGSPDIDIMKSPHLPELNKVREKYNIPFEQFGVVLFHPITTEVNQLEDQVQQLVEALIASNKCYVVIFPNNDHGSDIILRQYRRLQENSKFRVIPSMRFEYFLTLMKNSACVIGNSSAGVREAPFYGVMSVNIGSRQFRRAEAESILHCNAKLEDIKASIEKAWDQRRADVAQDFGEGRSDELFLQSLKDDKVWSRSVQKYFVDLPAVPLNPNS